ncbi:carboxymuconolactone decarboxylase family protein [Ramlibacter sp. AW1]|uniref:Carboxymuconolactone decarboxylase family protein n=1 Tax=Ramlibacter aurantiacus TaxID=2801330 RepID=A0A936ZUN5_9BURK|nr:carboxymuconolactone decarboxylase family protein [Ramlibacter aurantiacus]MBL0422906.1 carboxymuconolactone decarboxylase family protein [Ramlibacter aurantiacus]
MKPDRLPPIPPAEWTESQRREADEVIRGPRGALLSPFVPLLRSPEFMGHAQRMGEYLRYRSALSLRLSELAILVTARQWSQQVEWAIHAPIAQREGVAPATIAAIAEGRQPDGLPEDEAVVVAFSTELHRNRSVSDATWARAVALFGEQGVVDLLGINGYYTLLSMVMNGARTEVPASAAAPLPPMPDC